MMSEGNRTPTRQFVEIGDAHVSAESAIDVEDNMQSQLLERKKSWSEVDTRIVAPLATQIKILIKSVRELSERSSNRSTEAKPAPERSRSSGQRSDK